MNFVIPATLIDMAITFIIRQVDKFAEQVDWTKVKADLDTRVRDLIPGDFVDEFAVAILNKTVDIVSVLLKDEEMMTKLVALLREKKYAEAALSLRQFVKDQLGM